MKNRLNVLGLALLVVIGVLTWTVLKGKTAPPLAAAVGNDKPAATLTIRVQQMPPPAAALAAQTPVMEAPAVVESPADKSKYTAQSGDTVSNLAATLPGGDRKSNRDAVINANPSLKRHPDLVIAGKTYQIPAPAPAGDSAVAAAAPIVATPPVPAPLPTEVIHELEFTARVGDNVSTLAAALLGSDTKENRDAIIGANASLRNDPDRVIAGQTYRIPVSAGQPLASAPANELPTPARPTTQPDSDTLVKSGSPRELRYTAKPGDTVSTLAEALLGSDTQENRDAITNANQSLKLDPDKVIAGQTYWIPAPMPAQP